MDQSMRCPGLSSESYDLYLLGILEDPERDELLSHLAERCETCVGALQRSRKFLFSLSLLNMDGPAPGPELRRRILRSTGARPSQAGAWGWLTSKRGWTGALAAVVLIAAGIAIGDYGTRRIAPSAPLAQPPAAAENSAELAAAKRQNQALAAQLDTLRAASAQGAIRLNEARGKIESLLKSGGAAAAELSGARAEASASRQALTREQAQVAKIQGQLDAAQSTLASTEAQLRTSVAESKALDSERQRTTALQARVRELEQRNESYKAALENQRQEIQRDTKFASLLSSPDLRYFEFRGTARNPGARAHALVANGSQVLFVASALAPLPANRTYQLWLIRGQSPAIVSGGTFLPDRQGRAMVEFHNGRLARDIRALALTDEPAGGSPTPTGHQFLRESRS